MASEDYRQFVEQFLREEAAIRAYLVSATGDFDAAEDLLQKTAVALLEKWGRFDATQGFRPWALGFARVEALKWRQQAARNRERLSAEVLDLLAEETDRHADLLAHRRRLLAECVEALDAKRKGVLQMKYGQGLKISAIAETLNKSVAAVEMMLVRIRRALRDCVQRKGAESVRST